jgi:ssDNA-binding Zn-finger/Zn-ribbon topoisomerase 1
MTNKDNVSIFAEELIQRFKEELENEKWVCPLCKTGKLRKIDGPYGPFFGCTNYPDCKYTKKIGGKPNARNGK